MAAIESAKRITRIGQLFTLIGGSLGLIVWVFAYLGVLSHPIVLPVIACTWPIGLGAMIMGIGLFLEKL